MKGYAGKILRIDLTTKKVSTTETPKDLISNFLGGDGLGTKLLYDEGSAPPFSEKNPVIITPGLFTGFPVPTAGKTVFHSKSPLTNIYAESVTGGGIGAAIKHAGYDSVIITGSSEKPCYVHIEDENIAVKDAGFWGKNTRETAEIMKKEHGNDVVVASIGIAGEKLVRFACVDCEDRQAGRGGIGAVMGSKKLKAVAVKGTKDLTPDAPEKLLGLVEKWYKPMIESSAYKDDTKYGTGEFLEWMNNERGTFPTKNWQAGTFDAHKTISPYYWAPKYVKKNKACLSCVKPCGKLFKIESGKYKGAVLDGIEYETLFSLGSNCGNPEPEAVAKANELCDLYGVDTISCGGAIGFAMEMYEKGIITKKDTDGIELKFGNSDAVPIMVEKIAKRQGIGDILADGVRAASQKFPGSEKFAIHVKGMEPPAYDVRGIKGMGLAFMSSPRGACHLRSGAYALELTGKFWKFEGVDRFSSKNKGNEIKSMEDFMTVYDILGVCKFSRGIYLINGVLDFVEAVTGMKLSENEILKIAERINNLKRMYNIREGATRKYFKLPKRITSEPIPEGVSKGSYIKPEEAEEMLDDYFKARGWDKNGIPTKEKLKELGLEYIQ